MHIAPQPVEPVCPVLQYNDIPAKARERKKIIRPFQGNETASNAVNIDACYDAK